MRSLVAILSVLTAVCLTSTSEASLSAGDRIRFTDLVGTTGGGEFGVHLKDHANPFSGNTESAELFRTFCLEKNEFLDFHPNGFIIDSISKEAVAGGAGGPNPDPISPETAWLYYNFTLGMTESVHRDHRVWLAGDNEAGPNQPCFAVVARWQAARRPGVPRCTAQETTGTGTAPRRRGTASGCG